MAKRIAKKRWEPSEATFQRLLLWLDQGADSHGEQYLDIRDRLTHYFARRNCPAPGDLADETLNRVARRLEETGTIDDIVPARYCYIVARFVLLESIRERGRLSDLPASDEQDAGVSQAISTDDTTEERERTLACLERCLDACPASERQLILDYYGAQSGSMSDHRRRLAERLGLTANALAIRAHRIRTSLEKCVRDCRDR